MIPRFRPPLHLRELLAALSVGRTNSIQEFEKSFAVMCGQKHAIAFPYGRTGLVALLKALGLRNKRVICPAYTCVVVPNAVVTSGNRPDFIDSSADANGSLAEAMLLGGQETGALIATSIFGHPVDLDALASFRSANPGVAVIQDCAHSFLCEWKGRPVHLEGDAAIFGLNVSKLMTSVFGGMVTTSDDVLAERVRNQRASMLIAPGWQKSCLRAAYLLAVYPAFYPPLFGLTERLRQAGALDRFTRYYREDAIDMPSDYRVALTAMEARVGIEQCRSLLSHIAARRRYAEVYREGLADVQGIAFLPASEGASFSHIAARVQNKNEVRNAALQRGIQLGEVIEYSVPEMAAYKPYCRSGADWPVARMLSQQTINLPVAGEFDRRMADTVIAVLRKALTGSPAPSPLPL